LAIGSFAFTQASKLAGGPAALIRQMIGRAGAHRWIFAAEKLPTLAPKSRARRWGTRLLGATSNTGILRLRSGL